MTNTNLEKQAREYFLKGGGGHEDGEAGAIASTFTFDGMVEMAAAFAEHMVEKAANTVNRNVVQGDQYGTWLAPCEYAHVHAEKIRDLKTHVI